MDLEWFCSVFASSYNCSEVVLAFVQVCLQYKYNTVCSCASILQLEKVFAAPSSDAQEAN